MRTYVCKRKKKLKWCSVLVGEMSMFEKKKMMRILFLF
jgi:hypothetical protein